MASFLTAAAAVIGESGIGGAIVRILIAYGISRLINKNTGNTNTPTAVDKGVRLQLQPDTTNPIPVLYGSSYIGGKVTDAQLVDSNKTMWYCLTLCEATDRTRLSDGAAIVNNIDEIYMNNNRVVFKPDGHTVDYVYNTDEVVDTNPRDLVQIYLFNNGSSTPVLPTDVSGITAPTTPAYSLMPGWTTDHKMTNLTFALIKLSYNSSKGITGLPTFTFKVSNNCYHPGDAIYDYLRNPISGAGLPDSQVDAGSLIALNTYSNDLVEFINPIDGQTETLIRYMINGIIDPSQTVFTNLQNLINASGSFINYDITTGKWGAILNRDATPTLHFNDSNILGGITVTGTSLDSMYNAVEVSFPHRELQSQMDVVRINIPRDGNSYLNPNEPENILKITYDMLDEPLQALELGYIELYQNRMDQVITFTTDYSMIQVEAADIITVTSAIYDWTHKPFRVVRVREIESDQGGLALEITAQEYDSYIYTAMGTPIRPGTPTGPGVPDIGVIGKPPAPTYTTANNNPTPSVTITGVTPSGIVERLEYWISTDNTTYQLVGSRVNSNGSVFEQGTHLSYTDFTLPAGTYYFKVRGANSHVSGPFSDASANALDWKPVPTINPESKVDPGFLGLGNLLPLLGIGALAYLAYKYLFPELLSALSDTELGKLLGIEDPTKLEEAKNALDKVGTPYFKIVQVENNLLLAANKDTLEFTAGSGITLTADEGTNNITIAVTDGGADIKTFKTIKTDGQPDIVAKTSADTLKFIAGAGITITQDATAETITISTGSGGGGGGGGGSGQPPVADLGTVNRFKLDNCEAISFEAGRTKPVKLKGYSIDRKFVTGGSTYTDSCFPYTFPTLVVPLLGTDVGLDLRGQYVVGSEHKHLYPAETPNTGHPWKNGQTPYHLYGVTDNVGGFVLQANSSHSALAGKTIYYKVIAANQIIAYCDFDDNGNLLSPDSYTCYQDKTQRHPVWGTTEFPLDGTRGYRFVTYSMIQAWVDAVGGKYPMNMIRTVNDITETQSFGGLPKYTNYSRYCESGTEPSYDYNT